MERTFGKKIVKRIVIAAIAVIVVILMAPFCRYMWMRFRVLGNMKRIYKDAHFVNFSCDSKPIPEGHLDSYVWYGGEEPEGPLYAFTIEDSEGRVGYGYAAKDGTVILDSYSSDYYHQDLIDYFEKVVDFKTNFSELDFTPVRVSPRNIMRLAYTEDCSTFEGYLKARLVGTLDLVGSGFSGISVGLNTDDFQYVHDINQILRRADFEVYVDYFTTDERITDENLKGTGRELGHYHPFGHDRYDTAILGETKWYDRMKEKDSPLFVIEITKKGTLAESYTLNYNGSITKRDEEKGTEEQREISDEDYITINRFANSIYADNRYPIISGSKDSDRHIKVKQIEFYPRDDGEDLYLVDKLYDVDEPDENLSSIMDLIEGYFE